MSGAGGVDRDVRARWKGWLAVAMVGLAGLVIVPLIYLGTPFRWSSLAS